MRRRSTPRSPRRRPTRGGAIRRAHRATPPSSLVGAGGDPDGDSTVGPMAPTAHLDGLPYTRQILATLGTTVGRTRLMRIDTETELGLHVDTNYYWWRPPPDPRAGADHARRRVPGRGRAVHMAAGEAWVFDTWQRHRVENPAASPRIHLVVDAVGSAALWDLRRTPRPRRPGRDARRRPGRWLRDERGTSLSVMPPGGDRRARVAAPRRRVAHRSTPTVAAARRAVLAASTRDWRSRGPASATLRDGMARFAALRDEADASVVAARRRRSPPERRRSSMRSTIRQTGAPRRSRHDRVADRPHVSREPSSTVDGRIVDPGVHRVVRRARVEHVAVRDAGALARGSFTVGGESHARHRAASRARTRGATAGRRTGSSRPTPPPAVAARAPGALRGRAARPRRRPTVPVAVRLLEKTPKNALRVPFLAAVFPDARFVYLYRDPRETGQQHARRAGGRGVRHLPDLPGWRRAAVVAAAHPRLARALGPARWPRSSPRSGRPHRGAARRPRGARPRPVVRGISYDDLVADPSAEIAAALRVPRPRVGRRPRGTAAATRATPSTSPHPEKWRRNADELDPVWSTARDGTRCARTRCSPTPAPRRCGRSSARSCTSRRSRAGRPGPRASPDALFAAVHTASFRELLAASGSSLARVDLPGGRAHRRAAPTASGSTRTSAPSHADGHGPRRPAGSRSAPSRRSGSSRTSPRRARSSSPPGRTTPASCRARRHVTGDIRIHDMACAGDELWVVNTRFSCLCTLDRRAQLRAALAAAVRHRAGRRGPLPPQRPGHRRRRAPLRHRAGHDRHRRRLARGQGRRAACCSTSPRARSSSAGCRCRTRRAGTTAGSGCSSRATVRCRLVDLDARHASRRSPSSRASPAAWPSSAPTRSSACRRCASTSSGHPAHRGGRAVLRRLGRRPHDRRHDGVPALRGRRAGDLRGPALPGIRYPEIVEPGADVLDGSFVLPDAALAELAVRNKLDSGVVNFGEPFHTPR